MTMTPTMAAKATECQKTKRKMEPSLPTWLVAAVAMQMDCASIILPMTPPALLVWHIRIGLKFNWWAVIFCKPPKKALEAVSLPVRATPSQPMYVPKNGKSQPVRVDASPSTAYMPADRVTHSEECVPENLHQLAGFYAQNDAGENGRQEASGAGCGQPIEIKLSVFRSGLDDH